MNQTNKRSIVELNKYWNERLCYLSESDRLDDGDAIWAEFNTLNSDDDDILFLEYLNDL
jgi:hypothetical protein